MYDHRKAYTITLAEPWDYEGPNGKNIIRGVMLAIINNYLIVFKANYLLNFGGITGDILILTPRFKNETFENIAIKDVNVNGGLLLDAYNESYEERRLKENSKFVLIGTLGR